MFQEYPNYKQYYHNINYKWNSKNTECKYYYENYSKHVIDYGEYIADEMNNFKDNQINVYYTDFDNSARLIKPNNPPELSTATFSLRVGRGWLIGAG